MEDPLIAAWAGAYGHLADLFISTEKAIYEQHQQTKGSWSGPAQFQNCEKKWLKAMKSPHSTLSLPMAWYLPKYEAGQYISVRVLVDELGLKQPRQYTLSTKSANQLIYAFPLNVKTKR